MKFKNMMLITFLLLAIFTIGAVSAAEDADALAVDDMGDEQVLESPVDDDLVASEEDSDVLGSPTMYITSDNITGRYSTIAGVYDYSDGIDGNVYLFADDIQIYHSQVSGKNSLSISGNDIIGSFSGTYNMKLVYNTSDGGSYSKEGTVNFEVPIINKEFAPEDFKVTFPNSEIDLKDEDAVIVSFYCPEGIKEDSSTIFVYYGDGEYDRSPINLESSDVGTYKNVTWGELYQWDSGVYNLRVCYSEDWENFLELGTNTLKVTETLGPDDFIGIMGYAYSPDDDVVNVWDSTESGLNGTVTVYANGNEVYTKNYATGTGEGILIYAKDLKGNFNGDYIIKVSYKKANGTEYVLEGSVYFDNIINVDPLKTTITASAMTVSYGDNKYLEATLKDSNGKVISGVDVRISVMGIEYPVKTDKYGKVKQSLSALPPGAQKITFAFDGNANYVKSSKTVTVTVKKATPKLTAAAKTFKRTDKTKKYSVTLKTNKNAAMSGVKVTIKVNKVTYSAKTNAKGVATFKLTKLTKTGKYAATVKSAATSYYAAKSVGTKITVK